MPLAKPWRKSCWRHKRRLRRSTSASMRQWLLAESRGCSVSAVRCTASAWLHWPLLCHPHTSSHGNLAHRGNVTSAGWQVTLCDPMWHVSSRSSVATLRTAIHLLLTYRSSVTATELFILHPYWKTDGTSQNNHRSVSQLCSPSYKFLKEKCFQLATRGVGQLQQLHLCRQPVPKNTVSAEKFSYLHFITRRSRLADFAR